MTRSQTFALVGAAAGLLSLVGSLPSGVRFVLLAAFVLVGPGSAVLDLFPPMERSLRLLLAPVIGVAAILLASTVAVDSHLWGPTLQLVALVVITVLLVVLGTVLPTRRGPARHSPAEVSDGGTP